MAEWADISNLWWLRPRNPQGSSSLPAFQLGAQIQQQRIQNDIRTKEMMLDHQYRMDSLKQQDRMTSARIQEYDRVAQERQDEENDMLALKDIMGPMAENKPFNPPTFKTEKGWRAFSQLQNSFSLNRWRQRLGTEAKKQQAEYYEKLGAVKQYAPDVFAEIWKRVEESGEFQPDMIGQIDEIYNREIVPRLTAPPTGMETGTIRQNLPGGGYATFTKPKPDRTNRLEKSRAEWVRDEASKIRQRTQQDTGKDIGILRATELAEQAYDLSTEQGSTGTTTAPPSSSPVPAFKFVPGKGLVPIQ